MSLTLDFLGPDELPKHLADTQLWFKKTKRKLEAPARLKKLWLTSEEHFYRNGHSERDGLLGIAGDLARLLHGIGNPPSDIRAVLREGAQAYAPVLRLLDYSRTKHQYFVTKSIARWYDGKTLNTVSGRIFRPADAKLESGFKLIRVTVKNQPRKNDSERALTAALMAWDFNLAKRIARGYQLQPAVPGDDSNYFGLLRQAVLGHNDNALVFLQNLPKGYDVNFPPKQRELAEGVIRKDCRLIKAGLKSLSKRFETA